MLVSVLVFLELVFCCTLYWQVYLAEQEAAREEHYKRILEKTLNLPVTVNTALQNLAQYAITREKKYAERFDSQTNDVTKNLAWLKKQLASQEKCREVFAKIEYRLGRGIQLMNEAKLAFDQTSSVQEAIDALNAKKTSFQSDFSVLIKQITTLAVMEQKVVSQTHPEQKRLRRLIQTILALGIGANIIFAIVLSRFFSRTITSRLAIMIDNTERFKEGKELNKLIAGSDEIAALDGSFHKMAQTVLEAQRMRQTFVAMISHDLRTPLTNVQAFLSLVGEGVLGEVPERVKVQAGKTEQNVSRLIRLINDLLVLEKMEAGKMQMNPKVLYLENLIEKSVDAINEFANNHAVSIEADETNAEVYADPDRLMQVIINLLSNAVKFSPRGGTVKVVVIENAEFIETQIIDQGRGVPAEFREAIFEKYQQVKSEDSSKKGGTGLGLPICKLIIEQSGGSIGVRSEDGKGSTFWFRLPQKIEAPVLAEPS